MEVDLKAYIDYYANVISRFNEALRNKTTLNYD